MVSTTLFLTAGRFGLAPTVKKRATAGLQLVDTDNAGLITGDPAGAYFSYLGHSCVSQGALHSNRMALNCLMFGMHSSLPTGICPATQQQIQRRLYMILEAL